MHAQYELLILAAAAVLGLVHILLAAAVAQPQRGMKWNVGPRDTPVVLTGTAGRLERAFANFQETFPIFAVAVIVAYLTASLSDVTKVGATLYLAGRILYLPLYGFGVSYLRSLAWGVSLAGIITVLVAIFL